MSTKLTKRKFIVLASLLVGGISFLVTILSDLTHLSKNSFALQTMISIIIVIGIFLLYILFYKTFAKQDNLSELVFDDECLIMQEKHVPDEEAFEFQAIGQTSSSKELREPYRVQRPNK